MSDIIATVWGLMTFAGFVVSLQIGKAEELARTFERDVTPESWGRARRWAQFVRSGPAFVLIIVVIVVAVYTARAGVVGDSVTILLLVLPVVAQLLFAAVVRSLIRPIPPIVAIAPVRLPSDAVRASPPGTAERVMFWFRNRTGEPLTICWIDFHGDLDEREREFTVPAQKDLLFDTYRSHRWLVRTADRCDVAVFDADQGIADVTEAMLRPDVTPPTPRTS